MRARNYCTAVQGTNESDHSLIIKANDVWSEIGPNYVPGPRPLRCSHGLTGCCGMCTYKCSTRCVWDVRSRLYMLQHSNENENETLCRAIASPSLTYIQGLSIIYQVRKRLSDHKFNYAPRIEIDLTSGRYRRDPVTQRLKVLRWPESGLCPWCVPMAYS